jgi:hypothetical protein
MSLKFLEIENFKHSQSYAEALNPSGSLSVFSYYRLIYGKDINSGQLITLRLLPMMYIIYRKSICKPLAYCNNDATDSMADL